MLPHFQRLCQNFCYFLSVYTVVTTVKLCHWESVILPSTEGVWSPRQAPPSPSPLDRPLAEPTQVPSPLPEWHHSRLVPTLPMLTCAPLHPLPTHSSTSVTSTNSRWENAKVHQNFPFLPNLVLKKLPTKCILELTKPCRLMLVLLDLEILVNESD